MKGFVITTSALNVTVGWLLCFYSYISKRKGPYMFYGFFSQWVHYQSLARVKETFAHPSGTLSTLLMIGMESKEARTIFKSMYIQIWSIMGISLELACVICAMLIQNSKYSDIWSRHESTFWLKWCININSQSRHMGSRFDNQILLGSV